MEKLCFKNWHQFQHYKQRTPPWIKLHRSLLDDLDYHAMSPMSAKLLPLAWLIASEHNGELPDIELLTFRLRASKKDVQKALTEWNQYFIDDASAVLADCKQDAPLEESRGETEIEGECASKKRASTFPKDFSISDSMKEWASKRVPGIDIEVQLDKFTAHHKSKGSKFVDWPAAWRKWMLNAYDWAPKNNQDAQPEKPMKPKDLPDGWKWQLDADGNKIGVIKPAQKTA